jgi:hypothetical protein
MGLKKILIRLIAMFRRTNPEKFSSDEIEREEKTEGAVNSDSRDFQWIVFGESVLGSVHERRNLPNQDAIQIYIHQVPGEGNFAILAVADGHGSAKCFRSNIGSRLAVEIAVEQLKTFLRNAPETLELSEIKRALLEQLPREIVFEWKQAVGDHLDGNPLLVRETAQVAAEQGMGSRESVEKNPLIAYGTTLLIAMTHPRFIAGLQLGDGDMLRVHADGSIEPMMEEDDRLLANETTSLCGDHAWRDFRFSFSPILDRPPALLLISTDGYSNSFSSEADFHKVGSDLLNLLRTEGVEYVRSNLENWLSASTRKGSGDDVTAGLFYCPAAKVFPDQEHPDITEVAESSPTSVDTPLKSLDDSTYL